MRRKQQDKQILLTRDESESLRRLAIAEGTTISEVLVRFALVEAMRRGLYPPPGPSPERQQREVEPCVR